MPPRSDRPRRADSPFGSVLVRVSGVVLALVLIATGVLLLRTDAPEPVTTPTPDPVATTAPPDTIATQPPAEVGAIEEPRDRRPMLALVIDDLGHNYNELTRRALALPGPVTFAVLPDLDRSVQVLEEIGRAGKPALLHLPMEPEPDAGYDAGQPQVRVGDAPETIRAIVHGCLDGLPGVVGVNNHMGSRATTSWPEMLAVMEVLAERDLLFLDSQTTPHSVAHVAATHLGVPNLRNDIFLDVDAEDPTLVLDRLDQLVAKARRRGWAIGIGHVNEPTVAALEVFLPGLDDLGIEVVGVDALIRARAAAR